MKISEIIAQLEEIVAQRGDISVCLGACVGRRFHVVIDGTFEGENGLPEIYFSEED